MAQRMSTSFTFEGVSSAGETIVWLPGRRAGLEFVVELLTGDAVARPILARPSMAAHAGLRAARMVARAAAFLAERMGNLDSSTTKGVLDE
jgi:hypothetical protein